MKNVVNNTPVKNMGQTKNTNSLKAYLLGVLFIAFMFMAICCFCTQYTASYFDYDEALGRPLAWKVYNPFDWFSWQSNFYDYGRSHFNYLYITFILTIALSVLLTVVVIGFITRSSREFTGLHGTAHFATDEEILHSGLVVEDENKSGVYLGMWKDLQAQAWRYLKHCGAEHIMTLAPTRSAKGVAQVITTLLGWLESCIVNDQKGELWALTSGWRSKHVGKCYKFCPTGEETIRINPLDEIRLGTSREVGDTQNIVTILVDPDGKGLESHWDKTAFSFITSLVLHILYKARAEGKTGTLADVGFAMANPDVPVSQLFEEMLNNKWGLDGARIDIIASGARKMLDKPDEERGSVISTCQTFFSLYEDPLVAYATSASDIKISELMNTERPSTLYLVTREEDKDRLKPLIRLIYTQLVRVLLRPELTYKDGQAVRPYKHRILAMVDEFPALGRMDVFAESLSYIAGYGIKVFLIMQDMEQLIDIYGKNETVSSNCHVKTAYAPNKIETAEWLSQMLGVTTIIKEEISTSGKRFGAVLENVTRSYQEVSRPLMTSDEVRTLTPALKDKDGLKILEPGDVLIIIAGQPPILATQSLYFMNPVFLERTRIQSPPVNDALEVEAFCG